MACIMSDLATNVLQGLGDTESGCDGDAERCDGALGRAGRLGRQVGGDLGRSANRVYRQAEVDDAEGSGEERRMQRGQMAGVGDVDVGANLS